MRYLGLDVHGAATVYCLLDAAGAIVERGSVTTTFTALTELARRLSRDEELTAGQEVGTMCHFVHDIFTSVGVRMATRPRRSGPGKICPSRHRGMLPRALAALTTSVRTCGEPTKQPQPKTNNEII